VEEALVISDPDPESYV